MGKVVTFVDDAVLLLLLTISIPFVFLIIGTPLALMTRVAIEILHRLY